MFILYSNIVKSQHEMQIKCIQIYYNWNGNKYF